MQSGSVPYVRTEALRYRPRRHLLIHEPPYPQPNPDLNPNPLPNLNPNPKSTLNLIPLTHIQRYAQRDVQPIE